MSSVAITGAEKPLWQLRQAILVYLSGAGAYATLHDIQGDPTALRLGAGRPATKEACADLARKLGAMASLSGFVPPELCYLGARSIIWWRPAAKTTVFFDTRTAAAGDQEEDQTAAKLIGKRSGSTPQPALVFAVGSGGWHVFALRDSNRPAPGTKLCRAPYFNVYSSGEICEGNVRLPEQLSPSALAEYERAFFDSNFTHPNIRGKDRLVNHKGGAYAFWRQGLDRAWGDRFPVEALVPLDLTLQGLARRLEKDKGEGDAD
ncbi:MAG TPA: PRTRC system protein B [Burkholderiales bacterium]|nr:PRTRC system protein B [Burkholderiales bacterium]